MSDPLAGQALNIQELKRITDEKETAKLKERKTRAIARACPKDRSHQVESPSVFVRRISCKPRRSTFGP